MVIDLDLILRDRGWEVDILSDDLTMMLFTPVEPIDLCLTRRVRNGVPGFKLHFECDFSNLSIESHNKIQLALNEMSRVRGIVGEHNFRKRKKSNDTQG